MKKSKWDIIGNDIEKDNNQEYIQWFYYWYDGYYYDDDSDYGGCYELIDEVWTEHISKRAFKVSLDRRFIGGHIDMMSIYSPQILRQRKIDYLLGVDKWEIVKKPTFGDLVKNKDNNED